jgi:aldose 1-epimerase
MLALRSAANSVVVMPENGAGVLGWMFGETPILRRALPDAISGNPQTLGWFPLVPYCNRIDQARFRWAGRAYQLDRNFGDHPHAIHGVGWQRAWTVREAGAQSATLSLDHAPDRSWPFGFHAVVRYHLTPATVAVTIAVTNRHDAAAPAGIGLHPYFAKEHDPSLQFNADGAWENGADSLPSHHMEVPPAWQHSEPRKIATSQLDNCFTGWDRSATILAGPASLHIEAGEPFRQAHVFTPSWADFFCVEPVSHVPDAINRPGLPAEQAMHVLLPGETLSGSIYLTLLGATIPRRRPA